jgi:hypothetical protein
VPGKPFIDHGISQRLGLLSVAGYDFSGHFNVPGVNGYDPLITLNPDSDRVSYSLVIHIAQLPHELFSSTCSAVSSAVAFVLPGKLVKRRLITASAVAIFRQVELLTLVIFNTHAMLIAPAILLSIEAARFHTTTIQRWPC